MTMDEHLHMDERVVIAVGRSPDNSSRKPGMSDRLIRWAIALAALVTGLLLMPHAFVPLHPAGGAPLWSRLLYVGVGWSFIFGGLVAWQMRAENRTGKLMVVAGVLFWLALLLGVRVPIVWSVASAFEASSLVLLVYLLLSFPDGRLDSWWTRAIASAEAARLTLTLVGAPFYDPAAMGCPNCQPGLNVFLVRSDPDLVLSIFDYVIPMGIVVYGALLVALIVRWFQASVPRRRVLTPMLIPALLFTVSYLGYIVFQQFARIEIYEAPVRLYHIMLLTIAGSFVVMPIMFVLGLARLRARRARVGELVMELGDLPTPEQLQVLLRRTLGDPSLEVGLWVPDAKRFLTAEGVTLSVPDASPDRTSTVLERHGEPLALIVHDAALLDDPSLVDSVTAATRLAVENDRLQQEVLEKLVEVHDSRARLLQAADSERKRIERNLHDGAQQRLVSATLGLRMLGAKVGEESQVHDSIKKVEDELKSALDELRELARGTYPALLTERGLSAALETLADRSEIPVRKDLDSLRDRRFPENVEATAYFAGSEALANASKHSQASLIKLSARADDRDLIITVADDGRGGASIKKGSGLRGLLDRIHAADGEMDIESSADAGTTITIRLPCE